MQKKRLPMANAQNKASHHHLKPYFWANVNTDVNPGTRTSPNICALLPLPYQLQLQLGNSGYAGRQHHQQQPTSPRMPHGPVILALKQYDLNPRLRCHRSQKVVWAEFKTGGTFRQLPHGENISFPVSSHFFMCSSRNLCSLKGFKHHIVCFELSHVCPCAAGCYWPNTTLKHRPDTLNPISLLQIAQTHLPKSSHLLLC